MMKIWMNRWYQDADTVFPKGIYLVYVGINTKFSISLKVGKRGIFEVKIEISYCKRFAILLCF